MAINHAKNDDRGRNPKNASAKHASRQTSHPVKRRMTDHSIDESEETPEQAPKAGVWRKKTFPTSPEALVLIAEVGDPGADDDHNNLWVEPGYALPGAYLGHSGSRLLVRTALQTATRCRHDEIDHLRRQPYWGQRLTQVATARTRTATVRALAVMTTSLEDHQLKSTPAKRPKRSERLIRILRIDEAGHERFLTDPLTHATTMYRLDGSRAALTWAAWKLDPYEDKTGEEAADTILAQLQKDNRAEARTPIKKSGLVAQQFEVRRLGRWVRSDGRISE